MSEQTKIVRAPCNDCGRETDHDVLKAHETNGSDRETETSWSTEFLMLECRGCHFISLKRTFWFSEYDGLVIEYFPPPVSRRKPDWEPWFLLHAPFELQELLNEVYSSLHANNGRLAAMGSRALLDMAIVALVGDVGPFAQKLKALENEGHVSRKQKEFLDAALEAGNAAAHRGHKPSASDLKTLMDIVEHVLHEAYVLPYATEALQKNTPKRERASRIPQAIACPTPDEVEKRQK